MYELAWLRGSALPSSMCVFSPVNVWVCFAEIAHLQPSLSSGQPSPSKNSPSKMSVTGPYGKCVVLQCL